MQGISRVVTNVATKGNEQYCILDMERKLSAHSLDRDRKILYSRPDIVAHAVCTVLYKLNPQNLSKHINTPKHKNRFYNILKLIQNLSLDKTYSCLCTSIHLLILSLQHGNNACNLESEQTIRSNPLWWCRTVRTFHSF